MTIRVFQFWAGSPVTIREVELPMHVVQSNDAKADTDGREGVVMGLLNAVWHYGQNEIQSQQAPSVSVGDIIELTVDGIIEHWVVAGLGFENYGFEKHFMFSGTAAANRATGPGFANTAAIH